MEGVFHEHGDGHGADSAGDRGDGGAVGGDFWVGHVSDEPGAGFFRGVRDAVDADIDDDGTGLDPICLYHFRAAYGGDEYIGTAANGGEVCGAGVGDGDGGVGSFCEEEHGHGLADDHGAANDDGFCSFGLDPRDL